MPVTTYFRKPSHITVIPADELINNPELCSELDILIRRESEVFNKKQNSWIAIQPGDVIRVDLAPDDVYPIALEYLEENFDEADQPTQT